MNSQKLIETVAVGHSFSVWTQGYWRQWADERFDDPPPRWIQEPSVVRDKDGKPQADPLAVHCFYVCSGSVLLGDLGVSRSGECDLLSVLFIYPRFLCVSSLCLVAFFVLILCRICFVVLVMRKGGQSS